MNEEDRIITESPSSSEIEELRRELKKLKSMIKAILVLLIILTSFIVIYLLYKMTIGSIFGQLIGFVTRLFGG